MEAVRFLARVWASERCTPPLPQADADKVVDSLARKESGRSALDLLPCRVVRQHQYGTELPVRYEWELDDGTRIDVGDAPLRNRATEAHKYLAVRQLALSPQAQKKWPSIVRALMDITTVYETATDADAIEELMLGWLDSTRAVVEVEDVRAALRDEDPDAHGLSATYTDPDGRLWFSLSQVLSYAQNVRRDSRLTMKGLATHLRPLGFEKVAKVARGRTGRRSHMWVSPPGFVQTNPQRLTGPATGGVLSGDEFRELQDFEKDEHKREEERREEEWRATQTVATRSLEADERERWRRVADSHLRSIRAKRTRAEKREPRRRAQRSTR